MTFNRDDYLPSYLIVHNRWRKNIGKELTVMMWFLFVIFHRELFDVAQIEYSKNVYTNVHLEDCVT